MQQDFTCDKCKGTFKKKRPEAEAIAEKEQNFPGVPLEECGTLCNPCYEEFEKWLLETEGIKLQ